MTKPNIYRIVRDGKQYLVERAGNDRIEYWHQATPYFDTLQQAMGWLERRHADAIDYPSRLG